MSEKQLAKIPKSNISSPQYPRPRPPHTPSEVFVQPTYLEKKTKNKSDTLPSFSHREERKKAAREIDVELGSWKLNDHPIPENPDRV